MYPTEPEPYRYDVPVDGHNVLKETSTTRFIVVEYKEACRRKWIKKSSEFTGNCVFDLSKKPLPKFIGVVGSHDDWFLEALNEVANEADWSEFRRNEAGWRS
jgi:hypothetical protein